MSLLAHRAQRGFFFDGATPSFWMSVFGRHLLGVWIGGIWNGHCPEPAKNSEAELSKKIPEITQSDFRRISGSEVSGKSEPQKMQVHTPSRSISPLDSLLCMCVCVGNNFSLLQERKKHINTKKRTRHPPCRTPPRNSLCGGPFSWKIKEKGPPT